MWDYDNGQQPILFDMRVDGEPVKALAQANKNAWLYILNRETGEPVHPIIETPVPTETDREGEQPWPTQPIPHKANGERMEPVSPIYPTKIPPESLEGRVIVPQYTPFAPNQIRAGGGASYGPIAHSPQTGLLPGGQVEHHPQPGCALIPQSRRLCDEQSFVRRRPSGV